MPLNEIPEEYRDGARTIAQALRGLSHVVVSAHVNPDGDALGSVVASSLILSAMGLENVLYSSTGIPEFLRFFPLPAPLITSLDQAPFRTEGALLVDCGEFHRIGGDLEIQAPNLPRVNVDHHEGRGMGTLATWVAPEAAATCQLLAYVAMALDIPLQGELARAVALGVVTDTGGFAHANTSADVFELCAHLVRNGCNISRLREELDGNVRHERMRLWSGLTNKVEFLNSGRVAFCAASREDLALASAKREDLEGLVEYLRNLKGVKLAALLREDEDCRCKFSLRSVPDVDALALARTMHGGGHRNAAGGTIVRPFVDACAEMRRALATVML